MVGFAGYGRRRPVGVITKTMDRLRRGSGLPRYHWLGHSYAP